MFTTIIWATDSSDHAVRALPYAVALAKEAHTPLHAVHIVEKISGGRVAGQFAFADEEGRKAAINAQVDAVRAEHSIDVELHMIVGRTGHVAHRIAELGQDLGADLIVVGTHGHTALGTALVGSVTQQLLREAACPVLAVPRIRNVEAAAQAQTTATTA